MGKTGESSVFCKTSTSIYFMKLIQNNVKTAQIVFEMRTVSLKEFTILFSKIIVEFGKSYFYHKNVAIKMDTT